MVQLVGSTLEWLQDLPTIIRYPLFFAIVIGVVGAMRYIALSMLRLWIRFSGSPRAVVNFLMDDVISSDESTHVPDGLLRERILKAETALSAYSQGRSVDEPWCVLNYMLMIMYIRLNTGNIDGNLTTAISYGSKSLEYWNAKFPPSSNPRPLTISMNHQYLGEAYRRCSEGRVEINLARAADHYLQSVAMIDRESFSDFWASTHEKLGEIYGMFPIDVAKNIDSSIYHLELALEVLSCENAPLRWASVHHNLGAVYSSRLRGDPAENMETALSHLQEALTVYTPDEHPLTRAAVQCDIGSAYLHRSKGSALDNLNQSIYILDEALAADVDWEQEPLVWGALQNNLGNTFAGASMLFSWSSDANKYRSRARQHYQKSLRVVDRSVDPFKWAKLQENLGIVCVPSSNEDNGSTTWESCLEYFENACEVLTESAYPFEWAENQVHIASLYRQEYPGVREVGLEMAIKAYRAALRVYTPETDPQNCLYAALTLGRLLYQSAQLEEAREALETAHSALELLRGQILRDDGKRQLGEENSSLYALLVSCCLLKGDEGAALRYATAGKGRSFVDALATARVDLSAAGADNPELAADLRKASDIRQRIDDILAAFMSHADEEQDSDDRSTNDSQRGNQSQLSRRLMNLRAQDAALWEDMAYRYPVLTATQVVPEISASQAQALARDLDGSVVEHYEHDRGWCAFLISATSTKYVELPLLDSRLIGKMRNWVRRISDPSTNVGRSMLGDRVLESFHGAVMAPLEEYLKLGDPIIVAPFGDLHLLPFAAAKNQLTGRYLCEDYQLTLAPSVAALHVSLIRARKRAGNTLPLSGASNKLLSVAFPGSPHSLDYLPGVLDEAKLIERQFKDVVPLRGVEATPNAVIRHAPGKEIVHFGCHGRFEPKTPTESGLVLSDGWLTVQRIITELHLESAVLTTVAACQSGQMAVRSGEEHVGLIQALMTAGAQMVVASLWQVDDEATCALFEAFYAQVNAGVDPTQALSVAAAGIRARPEWSHPYFWAPFQVSGLPRLPNEHSSQDLAGELQTLGLENLMLSELARFTPSARNVLRFAVEEALLLHHSFVGTEGLLLGVLRQGSSHAAILLESKGIRVPKMRVAVEFIYGTVAPRPYQGIVFTDRARRILDHVFIEADNDHRAWIGADDIVLGILLEGESIGVGILESLGVERLAMSTTLKEVRNGLR